MKNENTLTIPGRLVEEAIQSAPSSITIYDRTGQEAMQLGGRNGYFGMGTDLITTLDLDTGAIRPTVLGDVVNAARVADACPEVDFVASFGLPHEVPDQHDVRRVRACHAQEHHQAALQHRSRQGRPGLHRGDVRGGCRRRGRVAGKAVLHPLFGADAAAHALLRGGQQVVYCADKGVPICYPPGAVSGGSAPGSLAGGIVQSNAEALSGIVLHQLRARARPLSPALRRCRWTCAPPSSPTVARASA